MKNTALHSVIYQAGVEIKEMSQELGAARPDQAEMIAKYAVRLDLSLYGVSGAVHAFGTDWLVRLFREEPEPMALGSEAL